MSKRILILQGHPHSGGNHLCHALAEAYGRGAQEAGFKVETLDVGALDFPILRDAENWKQEQAPSALKDAQTEILRADHIVIVYPLWLGTMPALLKAFLEQTVRPSMVQSSHTGMAHLTSLLKGKSARIIVTMGMPAVAYRLFYRMHSVKSLQRNILGFVGVGPIFTTLVGSVDSISPARFQKLKDEMTHLGRSAR